MDNSVCFVNGICCLIRKVNGERQYGFLIRGSWTVNLGCVFDGGNGEVIEYNSEEEILSDGWKVD